MRIKIGDIVRIKEILPVNCDDAKELRKEFGNVFGLVCNIDQLEHEKYPVQVDFLIPDVFGELKKETRYMKVDELEAVAKWESVRL